jgi:hypothetical protein
VIDRGARRLRTILALVAIVLSLLWGAFLAREHLGGRASVLNRIDGPVADLLFVLTGRREPRYLRAKRERSGHLVEDSSG